MAMKIGDVLAHKQGDGLPPRKKSVWMGARPTHCDLCGDPLIIEFVDGRTRSGQWGILCRPCHAEQGVGVGLGKGQVYNLGTLEKVEG